MMLRRFIVFNLIASHHVELSCCECERHKLEQIYWKSSLCSHVELEAKYRVQFLLLMFMARENKINKCRTNSGIWAHLKSIFKRHWLFIIRNTIKCSIFNFNNCIIYVEFGNSWVDELSTLISKKKKGMMCVWLKMSITCKYSLSWLQYWIIPFYFNT